MRILISNNADNLTAALSGTNSATVEAEYGETVVQGSILTLAHHGDRASRPCPCSLPNMADLGVETIGVSHFDLDTLGGVMAILGRKPEVEYDWLGDSYPHQYDSFWDTAAAVDLNGVHKLSELMANGSDMLDMSTTEVVEALNAFWAWSESNRLFPERDGSVTSVTEFFETAMEVVEKILQGDETLLQAGRDWATAKAQLDKDSLVESMNGVQLRSSDSFVNHLYGTDTRAIVGYSTKFKSITVSVPDAIDGFSCGEFLQGIFGPEAGGHAGIGGSPRGIEYTLDDAREVAVKLAETLA